MRENAQSSLEYMVMLALALGVFTAILYVVSTLIASSSSQIGINSAFRAVEEMKESADFVYVHGHPSKVRVDVYIPPSIYNVSIYADKVIDVRLDVPPYHTDVYSVARGNITGNLSKMVHEGYYVVYVESLDAEWSNITVE